jgi:hypothetical protein
MVSRSLFRYPGPLEVCAVKEGDANSVPVSFFFPVSKYKQPPYKGRLPVCFGAGQVTS